MLVTYHYRMDIQDDFRHWLLIELEKHEWSQAELARKSKLTKTTISRIISGNRNVGREAAEGIAKAFKYPVEMVFRKAGLLPPARDENPTDEELLHLFDQLDESEQEDILGWIRLKVEQNKKKKGVGGE